MKYQKQHGSALRLRRWRRVDRDVCGIHEARRANTKVLMEGFSTVKDLRRLNGSDTRGEREGRNAYLLGYRFLSWKEHETLMISALIRDARGYA